MKSKHWMLLAAAVAAFLFLKSRKAGGQGINQIQDQNLFVDP